MPSTVEEVIVPKVRAAPKMEDASRPAAEQRTQQSVICFDWDDTLLASSFLAGKGYRLDSNKQFTREIQAQLCELEAVVCNVLTLAMSHGDVIIITNAETGWVELSAKKFIPGVLPLLKRVTVISARSTFEGAFPDSPLKWKFHAFQEKLTPYFGKKSKDTNVLSFGDSNVEREAVRAVCRGVANTRCKSVKFAEHPTMEQLKRELELVTNCFGYVFNHEGDLDLQLTVTVATSPAPAAEPTAVETPLTPRAVAAC